MFNEKNYLRQLGVFECTIKSVQQKEGGSKNGQTWGPSIAVAFEDDKGRLIDGKFKTPLNDPKHKWHKGQWEELLKAARVVKPSELIGKKVAIFVAPGVFNGREFWSVKGYYDTARLQPPELALNAALDDIGSLTSSDDDLGF